MVHANEIHRETCPAWPFERNTVALSTFRDDFRRPAVFLARHRSALAEGKAAHLLPDATGLGLAAAGDDAFLEDYENVAFPSEPCG